MNSWNDIRVLVYVVSDRNDRSNTCNQTDLNTEEEKWCERNDRPSINEWLRWGAPQNSKNNE